MGANSLTRHSSILQATDASNYCRRSQTQRGCPAEKSVVCGQFGVVGHCGGNACDRKVCLRVDDDSEDLGGPRGIWQDRAGKGEKEREAKTSEGAKQKRSAMQRCYEGERRSVCQSTPADAVGILDQLDHRALRTVRSGTRKFPHFPRVSRDGHGWNATRSAQLPAPERPLWNGQKQKWCAQRAGADGDAPISFYTFALSLRAVAPGYRRSDLGAASDQVFETKRLGAVGCRILELPVVVGHYPSGGIFRHSLAQRSESEDHPTLAGEWKGPLGALDSQGQPRKVAKARSAQVDRYASDRISRSGAPTAGHRDQCVESEKDFARGLDASDNRLRRRPTQAAARPLSPPLGNRDHLRRTQSSSRSGPASSQPHSRIDPLRDRRARCVLSVGTLADRGGGSQTWLRSAARELL